MIEAMIPELHTDRRAREVASLVLNQPAPSLGAMPVQHMTMEAAVDLLPGWAREMHGLPTRHLRRPAVRLSTFAVAETLRWAFKVGSALSRHSYSGFSFV
ncbi:oxygenase MpaB family protein [Sphingobium yanoikuyae]|uniref:oxygenase MpaB family protein n=1 Tax=Sphingobium yanoikuyae TaxID=13690 RepID=UPI003F11554F